MSNKKKANSCSQYFISFLQIITVLPFNLCIAAAGRYILGALHEIILYESRYQAFSYENDEKLDTGRHAP